MTWFKNGQIIENTKYEYHAEVSKAIVLLWRLKPIEI